MKLRRFHASSLPDSESGSTGLQTSNEIILSPEESHHLRDVLRLKQGELVLVFDGQGHEYRCVVESLGSSGRDRVRLAIVQVIEVTEPSLKLILCPALLKGEKFDLVIEKATELGVTSIVPLISERCEIRAGKIPNFDKRLDRWRRITISASKQAGRTTVPELSPPEALSSVFRARRVIEADARLFFCESGGNALGEITKTWPNKPRSIIAIVGPEGGWAPGELAQAEEHDWSLITLGGHTLRAETASIVVAVLLEHLFGGLT